MKRKPKPLATRNPFVVLAMQRKAGSHRKPNKAMRRAEKVNTKDVAQRQSMRLLTDRQGFDPLHPYQSLVASDGYSRRFRECFAPVAYQCHFKAAIFSVQANRVCAADHQAAWSEVRSLGTEPLTNTQYTRET